MTKLSEVKEGDILIADDGFDCLSEGEYTVKNGLRGLCIICDYGNHYLDGQSENGELIGLKKK